MSRGANIERPYFRYPTAICDGETSENGFCDPNIGEGTRIWHHAHVMAGARIGRGCVLGQNVFVGSDVTIGDGCRIQNDVNVYDGVTLEDYVFCGPSMTFTNLSMPLPRAAISRRTQLQKTVVRKHASIGAGAVVVCGHTLGVACFVAAGSVVVSDVPDFSLVMGVPARVVGHVCVCGGRLRFEAGRAMCTARYAIDGRNRACGRIYEMGREGRVRLVEGNLDPRL